MLKKMNSLNARDVEKWLARHKQSIVEDIKRLVACDSVYSNPEKNMPFGKGCYNALTLYLSIAEKMGFETENHQGYCGSIFYGQGKKTLGLVTHLDVVEPGEGWNYNPFAATILGDYIVGRGSQDNKGAAIGALYAMKFYNDNKILMDYRMQLIAGCNEESGMKDIEYFLKYNTPPDFSLVTDCGFPVCCGEKGHIVMEMSLDIEKNYINCLEGGTAVNTVADKCKIELFPDKINPKELPKPDDKIILSYTRDILELKGKGKSAHASIPLKGENAIANLFKYLNGLKGIDNSLHEIFNLIYLITADNTGKVLGIELSDNESGSLTVSAGIISFDKGKIKIGMDVRYPVTKNGEEIINKLHKFSLEKGVHIEVIEDSPPYYLDKEDKKIKYLTKAFNDLTNDKKEPYTIGGGTHARVMPNAVGYGMAMPNTKNIFEDGRGLYHQPDEALHIPSLIEGIKVYIMAIFGLEI